MCGRYYIEIDENELWDINSETGKTATGYGELPTYKTSGEIFPADTVPVRTGIRSYRPMKWGFIGPGNKPVINARSETALEKPMFQKSMLEQRCLIPAGGYYEWQKDGKTKTKYRIYIPGSPIFFAGCWRQEKGNGPDTFVILTKPAAESIAFIHDRMPVIIPRSRIDDWLNDSPNAMREAVVELSYLQVT